MSFATVAAVGGLALAGYGAYDAHQQAGNMQDAQNRALRASGTQLSPFSVLGLGGAGVYRNDGNITMGPGADQSRVSQNLLQYASSLAPNAAGGLPPELLNAMRGVQTAGQVRPDFGFADLDRIGSQIGGTGAYNDLLSRMQTGFQRPLQNTAFRGAGLQLNDAMMGGDAVRSRQLDLLRAQAAPFEQRQGETLQNNLFATGRMGTTGGALQTEAFARGLGQADLDRQLVAGQEGRNFQQNAMGLASGMGNFGLGLTGQEDSLLQNAFGRFAQTAGMQTDLNRERFSRSVYNSDTGYNRSRDMLGLQTNMAQLPFQLDQMRIGNVQGALGTNQGIQDQMLQLFQAGLSSESAAANARIGSGSNMAQIVGSPNFGMGGMLQAGGISQLGTAMMGGQSMTDILGRIFRPSGGGTGGGGDALNQMFNLYGYGSG